MRPRAPRGSRTSTDPRTAPPALVLDAEATIPMRHGQFRFIVFRHADDLTTEHVAIVTGDAEGEDVLVRVHSECMTSEVFGSLKCDCAEQLDRALSAIGQEGRGVVIYLRRAHALRGGDTRDAKCTRDLPADARRYDAAAAMLRHLGVRGARLITDNPETLGALRRLGVEIRERVPAMAEARPPGRVHLATRRTRMRHVLP